MSTTAPQSPERLALCLSGGGFRATLFHLGVVRYLWESGKLAQVSDIFSVSGGSITAAYLAVGWEALATRDKAVFADWQARLVRFTQKDVAGSIFLKLSAVLSFNATAVLERRYEKLLLRHAGRSKPTGRRAVTPLSALAPPEGPRFYLLATNLRTGGPFCFTADALVSADATSEAIDVPTDVMLAQPHYPLARAVAASSAFPPLFPAVPLRPEDLTLNAPGVFGSLPALSDGGVFDNLGLNFAFRVDRLREAASSAGMAPSLGRKPRFDRVVVSDAGAPFRLEFGASFGLFGRARRTTDILMHRVSSLEPRPSAVTAVSIGPHVGAIRTNLDAFGDEEVRCLVWQGYLRAAEAVGAGPVTSAVDWDPIGEARAGRLRNVWDRLWPGERSVAVRLATPSHADACDVRVARVVFAPPPSPATLLDRTRPGVAWLRRVFRQAWRVAGHNPLLSLGSVALLGLYLLGGAAAGVTPESYPARVTDTSGILNGGVALDADAQEVIGAPTVLSGMPVLQRLSLARSGTVTTRPAQGDTQAAVAAPRDAAAPFLASGSGGPALGFVLGDTAYLVDGTEPVAVCKDPLLLGATGGALFGEELLIASRAGLVRCIRDARGGRRAAHLLASLPGETLGKPEFTSDGRGVIVQSLYRGMSQDAQQTSSLVMYVDIERPRRVELLSNASRPEVAGQWLLYQAADARGGWFRRRLSHASDGGWRVEDTAEPVERLNGRVVLDVNRDGYALATSSPGASVRLVRIREPLDWEESSWKHPEVEVVGDAEGAACARFSGDVEHVALFAPEGGSSRGWRFSHSEGRWVPETPAPATGGCGLSPGIGTAEASATQGQPLVTLPGRATPVAGAEPVPRRGAKGEFYVRRGDTLWWIGPHSQQRERLALANIQSKGSVFDLIASRGMAAAYDYRADRNGGHFVFLAHERRSELDLEVLAVAPIEPGAAWARVTSGLRVSVGWLWRLCSGILG